MNKGMFSELKMDYVLLIYSNEFQTQIFYIPCFILWYDDTQDITV